MIRRAVFRKPGEDIFSFGMHNHRGRRSPVKTSSRNRTKFALAAACAIGLCVWSPSGAQVPSDKPGSRNKAGDTRPGRTDADKKQLTSVVRHLVDSAADAEETLRQLDAECTRAAVQANFDALSMLESDDFTFTSPDGSIMTKAQDLETLKAGDLFYESISLDDVSVRAYRDAGVVTGRAKVIGWYKTFDISGSYRYTVTFARISGKWKVVASQMTRIQG
jgi:Domain of unknown function (DUF4440)